MAKDIQSELHDYFDHSPRDPLRETNAEASNVKPESIYASYREKLVRDTVLSNIPQPGPLLEVGCGYGQLALSLLNNGYACFATDLSAQRIQYLQAQLEAIEKSTEYARCLDFFDLNEQKKYKGLIANGVICYYPNQLEFLKKAETLLQADGKIVITHRNALFNLFALNKGTIDFFTEHLLLHLPEAESAEAAELLKKAVPGLQTPVQESANTHLYRSAENPLDIHQLYQQAGFEILQISYSYIHPAPPRLGLNISGSLIQTCQERWKNQWQGMFLGSQFLVLARKKAT